MPRCFSISIQSDTAARAFFLPLTAPAWRDGPAVEQEFFCQGGFTGVRVRDDRKGSAPGDFFFQGCHVCSSRSCFFKSKQRRCYMGHPPNLSVFFIFVITGLVYHMRSPFTSARTAFSAKMGRIPKGSPFRGAGCGAEPRRLERLSQICICCMSPTAPSVSLAREKMTGRKECVGDAGHFLPLNLGKAQCFSCRSTRWSPHVYFGTRRLIRGYRICNWLP